MLYVVKGVISGYTSCVQAFQKQSMKDSVMIRGDPAPGGGNPIPGGGGD